MLDIEVEDQLALGSLYWIALLLILWMFKGLFSYPLFIIIPIFIFYGLILIFSFIRYPIFCLSRIEPIYIDLKKSKYLDIIINLVIFPIIFVPVVEVLFGLLIINKVITFISPNW